MLKDKIPTTLTDSRLQEIDNVLGSDPIYSILQRVDNDLYYIYKTLLEMRITDSNNLHIMSMLNVLETNIKPFYPRKTNESPRLNK